MNKERRTVSNQFSLESIRKYSRHAVLFVLLSIVLLANSQAQNVWNQFRGPSRNGILPEAKFPDVWPENGPELLWTKDVGNGFPEVTFANDVAYIFSSDSLEGGYEYVAALNANSGKELWKTKVDSMWFEVDGWGHGPRATPAIDGEAVYCLSGYGKLTALNIENGEKIWQINLPESFGSAIPRWGFSSSPLLVEDILILETGGTDSRAFSAFNKKTGAALWSRAPGNTSYCSPTLATIDGQTNIVFANDTMLRSYTVAGDELWAFRMPLRMPTASPVFIAPNKFFVSSVSQTGSFIVEITDGQAQEILKSPTMQNNWSSSCYRDGYLYGFSKAKLQCVSVETGEMLWGKRGFGKGSLIMVADKLLVMSDQGKLIVVKAEPDQYTEIGSFQALEGKSWTPPSYADGKIYVRNLTKMACYSLTKK